MATLSNQAVIDAALTRIDADNTKILADVALITQGMAALNATNAGVVQDLQNQLAAALANGQPVNPTAFQAGLDKLEAGIAQVDTLATSLTTAAGPPPAPGAGGGGAPVPAPGTGVPQNRPPGSGTGI